MVESISGFKHTIQNIKLILARSDSSLYNYNWQKFGFTFLLI
jgi:hypothetical protein